MFVAFVGNSCTQIYIHTNVYTRICLVFIYEKELAIPTKIRPHEQGTFWRPTNIDPHE